MECSAQNEKLEAFAEGYFLFTYSHSRRSSSQPCRVRVAGAGLLEKTFEFHGTRNEVRAAGLFRARRFAEKDRRKVDFTVTGPNKKPIVGVLVALHANNRSSSNKILPVKTDSAGHTSASLYPGTYQCYFTAPGYNRVIRSLIIPLESRKPSTIEATMHPTINAQVKVVWKSEPLNYLGVTNREEPRTVQKQEGVLYAGDKVRSSNSNRVRWIRLTQVEDRLQLIITTTPGYYNYASSPGKPWVGRWTGKEEAGLFDNLELDKIEERKKQARILPSSTNPTMGMSLPVEKEALYVGRTITRDPRTNRPAILTFKVFVVDVSSGNEQPGKRNHAKDAHSDSKTHHGWLR